ncbi:MAG: type IX secretion system outer membrane channel protein PorV [Filimonas sp.]|nr:type IX secretion system outer membrane channel protein PorV [Filimonas sp.]
MKKNILYSVVCSVALVAGVSRSFSQQLYNTGVTSTAANFLRIQPDARTSAMGNARIAVSASANAAFNNIAQIPFAEENSGIAVTYSPWLKEIANKMFLATIAGYHKLDDEQALSASLRYFNLGDAPVTDYNGNLLQTVKPKELSFDVGYARKLSKKISLGLAFRYINSRLVQGDYNGTPYKAASAVAADISASFNNLDKEGQGFTAGLVIANLGTKMSYTRSDAQKYFLPATLGIGAAYTFVINEKNTVTLAVDANKLLAPIATQSPDSTGKSAYYEQSITSSWVESFKGNAQVALSGGVEYSYDRLIAFRAGYHYDDKTQGDQSYVTGGVGLTYNEWGVNFCYLTPVGNSQNKNPLSNTLRFGLSYTFGKDKK